MNVEFQDDRRFFRGGWWPRLPFAVLLILCGTLVYRPALNRVFVDDQIAYFAELDGQTSLASGMRLLDFAASRQYAKGDEVLYRPLLMAWLAVQNTVFGRDFRAWNMANLALHLMVAYLLFELLWRLHRSLLACGVALLFALLASNFELAMWSHLGGYMLGYGLLLAALLADLELVEDPRGAGTSVRWAWVYGIAMTGAMLVHEIAVVAGVAVIVHGVASCRRKPGARRIRLAAAWLAPLLIYAILYAFHAARCHRFLWVDPQWAPKNSLLSWAVSVPFLLWRWAVRILLPGHCRLAVGPFYRSVWMSSVGGWGAKALWIALSVCLWRGFARGRRKEAWFFGALLAFLIAAYAGMNLVGRPYAAQVAYYPYFPALFGAALLYSLVDFSRVGRGERACALAVLLLLAVEHGAQTRRTAGQIREANAPAARYYEWIEQSVRPKLSDPDFTLAVEGAPLELDPRFALWLGYPDWGIRVDRPMSTWFYGKRCNPAAPSETLVFAAPGTPAR